MVLKLNINASWLDIADLCNVNVAFNSVAKYENLNHFVITFAFQQMIIQRSVLQCSLTKKF